MHRTPPCAHLPVFLNIDRFYLEDLGQLGAMLQTLPRIPEITLIKPVPFFPAPFYSVVGIQELEKKQMREAEEALLTAMATMGIPVRYQIVRSMSPWALSKRMREGRVINTTLDLKGWLRSLKEKGGMPYFAEISFAPEEPANMRSIHLSSVR